MWFEQLTGFPETAADQVRERIALDGPVLTSRVNGRSFHHGWLETPSLAELRQQVAELTASTGQLALSEVVADARQLHADPASAGALFQVASQFNLLEMASPEVSPEQGIDRYERDRTQGPACAIAAGAGTIYRQYFAPVGDGLGQTRERQIDCLADIATYLHNDDHRLWTMQNGYALASESGLREINQRLAEEGDEIRQRLRIGLHRDTEVSPPGHRVTQAYCSALPVAYSHQPPPLWEPFARVILEAAYEATLLAGMLNAHATGNRRVYLTLLGGGAFGNPPAWILDALRRALYGCRAADLEIIIVSYGRSNPLVKWLILQPCPNCKPVEKPTLMWHG